MFCWGSSFKEEEIELLLDLARNGVEDLEV
jgi:hypothetical protein